MRVSRYARRRGRGGVESGEGLRRIADFDLGCELPLKGADAGGQDCVFLRKMRSEEGPVVCFAPRSGKSGVQSMRMVMVTMDAREALLSSGTPTEFDIKQRAHLLELLNLLSTQYLIATAVHHRVGRQQAKQQSIAGVSRLYTARLARWRRG